MQIEQLIAANTAALDANTAALREVLSAGGLPTNVVAITETPKPAAAPAKPAGKPAKTPPAAAPEPVVEKPVVEKPVVEKPTKVAVETPAENEFSDPLDKGTTVVVKGSAPVIDVEATTQGIIDGFKAKMVAAGDDADRKAFLKTKLEELRTKYGLAAGAKLATLSDAPEKLVGLLADVEAL